MMEKNMPWYIHRLSSMIGYEDTETKDAYGVWVRAVPEPYHASVIERIKAAYWVITGRGYVVIWPDAGDLERATGTYLVPKANPTQ